MVEMTRSDRTTNPPPYVRDVHREFSRSELPAGIGMRNEEFYFKHNRFIVSVATMLVTGFVVFFVPLFNGLIAGAFGGFHARTMRRALGAALVTSIALPAFIALFSFLAGPHQLRIFGGLGFWGWTALFVIGTFIGAATGPASSELLTEDFSATPDPVPADGPAYRTTTTTETVTREVIVERVSPPSEPVREE